MEELGDDREAMPDNEKDATDTSTEAEEEDDSELDRLLRHATLLVRGKTSNNRDTKEPMDEEEDDELDELLQRAVTLLRQRLTQPPEQDKEDEEIDRLLRRAMTLFMERRKRLAIGQNDDAELDVVGLKMTKAAKGSTSPGSSGLTDDEDDEDDELDSLLRRAMSLLRRRFRETSNVQESIPAMQTSFVPELSPLDWRKALRLQRLNQVQLAENLKRPRDGEIPIERKSKRARCLSELQEDSDVEIPAEAQSNESSSLETTKQPEAPQQVEQQQHEPGGVTVDNADPVSEYPQTIECGSDDELKILRASNMKLIEENADLKQKLQQQKADNNSDARMIVLLQEQVQRLQQRELEFMRALSCSAS